MLYSRYVQTYEDRQEYECDTNSHSPDDAGMEQPSVPPQMSVLDKSIEEQDEADSCKGRSQCEEDLADHRRDK